MRGRTTTRFTRRRWAARLGRLRWIWIGLSAAAVLVGLAWLFLVSSVLGVRSVTVSGERDLTSGEIRSAAAVSRNQPLARVDLGAIRDRVEEIPRVESATVGRAWPRGIAIEVRERTAIAVVTDGGSIQALDRNGVLFADLGKAPKRLPAVTLTAASGDRTDALHEVAAVVTSIDPAIARRIKRVEVASRDAITFSMRDGDEVRWGSAERSTRKAQVLRSLLRIKADVYDVTAPERPTTRR